MPPHIPDQARFYELQGSLSRPSLDGSNTHRRREDAGSTARRRTGNGLPLWLRITLIGVAAVLLAIGIAGLFLPGLQGILTILLGLALLSLVSRRTHRLLRWSLRPWPGLRKRVERMRHRSHRWLHRKVGNGRNGNGGSGNGGSANGDGRSANGGDGATPAA